MKGMVFEQMEAIMSKESDVGWDSLTEDEMKIFYEIIENPGKHVNHSLKTHRELCMVNGRCVLCMMDSDLIKKKQ